MSFLNRLREQQKANQSGTEAPAPTQSQPVADVPNMVAESGRTIEGTAEQSADSPAPQAQSRTLALLFGKARPATIPAPAPSDDSESNTEVSILDGGETDSISSDGVGAEGHGDAPVNAATVVETVESATGDSGESTEELFKLRLATLDELCQAESGISPLVHDQVKSHIRGIMEDLRDNPEMRGLLLDRDMHNIMLFIQSSTQIQQTKVEKTEKKRVTKAKNALAASAFDDAFASLDAVPSLADLTGMNTDKIESKVQ